MKKDISMNFDLSRIAAIIAADAEIITGKWMEKERRELSIASNAHRVELRNLIPKYLTALAAELSRSEAEKIDHYLLARDHGIQRWEANWRLDEVIADYQLLQITLLEHLAEALKRNLAIQEMITIGIFIDDAIIIAVTAFTEQSESALRSLNETLEERVLERTRVAKDKEAKLRKAGIDLIKAKQIERQRIARILHDDLQQLMAASLLRVEGLNPKMSTSAFEAELDTISGMLHKALTVSKNLAIELRPSVDPGNIPKLLKWIQERMQEEYDLQVTTGAGQDEIVVGQEIGLLTYQSLRELLFNVVKHGKCRQASVTCEVAEKRMLIFTVSDAGSGFDISTLKKAENKGFGLNYIQERLEMVGGKLDIRSTIGQGTHITMQLPLGL